MRPRFGAKTYLGSVPLSRCGGLKGGEDDVWALWPEGRRTGFPWVGGPDVDGRDSWCLVTVAAVVSPEVLKAGRRGLEGCAATSVWRQGLSQSCHGTDKGPRSYQPKS